MIPSLRRHPNRRLSVPGPQKLAERRWLFVRSVEKVGSQRVASAKLMGGASSGWS
jgi:hypothetical protein